MRVLIISSSDILGGAARAAYRLHRALLTEGLDSQMIVQFKKSDDFTVKGPQTKTKKIIGKIRYALDDLPVQWYRDRSNVLFSPNWVPFSGLVDKINTLNPDVVHLHWINDGMIRIEDLANINKPIVWSLHDMWAFTGGCHYDRECGAFKDLCGACPVLGSKKYHDLSKKILKRKFETFGKMPNLNIIGLSQWLAECAKQSYLFNEVPVFNLPNPIDTTIFAPFNKQEARELLNLPQDKKLIMFGAMEATSDSRKGYQELTKALFDLSHDYELVVFGSSEPKKPQDFKQKAYYLGHLHDDVSLRVLYSAADVMVVPSLQENLSNAIMESLACGTPVVGFNIGGNSDMVDHMKNGYLAKKEDVADLATGINWVLGKSGDQELSKNARKKVLDNFDSKLVSEKYIELYKSII